MPLGVLITQCLQYDFVARLGADDPIPGPLHIGHREAERLSGGDNAQGPLAAFMEWAHGVPPSRLRVIHIRDWHDPGDPAQKAHLKRFGNHCLKGTPGAQFVVGIEELRRGSPTTRTVNATGLNDFEGTDLAEALEEARRASPDGLLRVGVVGVWTDAKVSFLLYDLATRVGVQTLATCSAFTASASPQQHQNALDQLERLLDVRVEHSPGEFADWLVGDAAKALKIPKLKPGALVELTFKGEQPEDFDAADADRTLISWLYRECRRLEVEPMGGGYSGATVLLAHGVDAYGHELAPSVVKIGPRKDIGAERAAFERIEAVLGNSAPSITAHADMEDRGAVRYRYASMGKGKVRTFQSLYQEGVEDEEVERILRVALGEILSKLYAAASMEPIDLLAAYSFDAKWASHVAGQVKSLVSSDGDMLALPGFGDFPNVTRFYDRELGQLPRPMGQRYPVSFVHGDLNGQNLIVDEAKNVWVIDFGRVRRTHVLCDFAKFENDLLYVMTPLSSSETSQARITSEALYSEDLSDPAPEPPKGVTAPALRRAWRTVACVRALARQVAGGNSPSGYRTALLRFAAHTLSFSEPSLLQRQWALCSAGILSREVARETVEADRLWVDWVGLDGLQASGGLGLTMCPGRADRKRSLSDDLRSVKAAGVTHLVSLIPPEEAEFLGVRSLAEEARALGLGVIGDLTIPDGEVPDLQGCAGLSRRLGQLMRDGKKLAVHCRGGLGRSGTIAATTLVELGLAPPEAIRRVRTARGVRAIDPGRQEAFVRAYRPSGAATPTAS